MDMTDQLSLFPDRDVLADSGRTAGVDTNALDEMFEASRRFRDGPEYLRLLAFIARFPKYSALNGFLLYIQNAGATYLATSGTWLRQFSRRPFYTAKPLVILAPMSPVLFLYDLEETEGEPFPQKLLQIPDCQPRLLREVLDRTIRNAAIHGIAVRSESALPEERSSVISLTYGTRKEFARLNIDSRMKYLLLMGEAETLEERYTLLVHGLGHIFCGHVGIDTLAWWQDRSGTDPAQADIEADSATFLVCRRRGSMTGGKQFLSILQGGEEELPALSLNGVFHATHYIEQMGKSEWKQPRKQSRYLRTER